jgi:hypothetical protein
VACRELLENDEGPLVTTAMVIAEAAYLIDRQLGAKAEASLYASVIEGQIEVADLDINDCGSASKISLRLTLTCDSGERTHR